MSIRPVALELVRSVRGIDHVTITTRDCRASGRFYALALRPLGFRISFAWPEGGRVYLGLPSEGSSLWLVQGRGPHRAALSLAAEERAGVDAFYAAALAAGGEAVSAPAYRPEHSSRTYAAEVRDLDGNTIEAVCWRAEPQPGAAEHAA